MKNIYDNQLSITDDLNDYPVIFHEIKPSDFLIHYKNFGLGLKNIHHKINIKTHIKHQLPFCVSFISETPYWWSNITFDSCVLFSDFNQPYFKTR